MPRELLTVPEYFDVHENVEWHLADTATDAVHLARAREQHELAYAIWVARTASTNSVQDVALAIETRYNTLQPKLKGWAPATEDDLIRWSWLVGAGRRFYMPRDLWATEFRLPKFPLAGSRLP